jgi:Rod binding domain-containing protein
MMMAQSQPVKAPSPTGNAVAAGKAAKEFESVFISQFLGSMFSGISTDGPTGGGEGEEMFRSLMVDQYGKSLEQRGGFGLAAAVQRQLIKQQEMAMAPTSGQTSAQAANQPADAATAPAPPTVN